MIELLCTVAGLVAGATIAASLISVRQEQVQFELESKLDLVEADRMKGVALQLQSLSQRVYSDVSSHSEKVEMFSTSIAAAGEDDPVSLLSAIDEILIANKTMQSQLEDAKKRIAEQSQVIEQTTRQARTDSLTGLANRRALDEYLASCLQTKSEGSFVGLLLMDIDRFKSFNDTYGHTTGDGVLKCFARSIAQFCGPQAFPARYGGEEFAVIFCGDSALRIAENAAAIREYVSQQTIYHEDLELTVTASGGLCFVEIGEDIKAACDKADEGLYMSKQNGRNQGFWLTDNNWEPFPKPSAISTGFSAEGPQPEAISASTPMPDDADSESSGPDGEYTTDTDSPHTDSVVPKANYLELSVFVDRVSEHLGHLSRSGLPASCIMVEAIAENGSSITPDSWQRTASVIESKLRGIDLISIFRPSTACLFLPGSSSEAAIEKAGSLLLLLNSSLANWNCETTPRHFAISVGQSQENEDAGPFLDRIEKALEEAQDASLSEIVVHSGQSTYFQQV